MVGTAHEDGRIVCHDSLKPKTWIGGSIGRSSGSFLPDRIIDVHTHVWLKDFRKAPPTGRAVTWPLRVAEQDPIEDLVETYELLFPGKAVKPLMFSFVESHEDDVRSGQRLCRPGGAGTRSLPPLSLPRRDGRLRGWSAKYRRAGSSERRSI